MTLAPALSRPLLLLAALHFAATLAHFSHNAEYIAFYPGMPAWLDRGTVYLAWLAVTGSGVVALACAQLRRPALALLALAVYGACGLDGLAHYTLALCSEHTLASNATILAEAVTGVALLSSSAVAFLRRVAPARLAG